MDDYISREAAIKIICGPCASKAACDAGVETRCSYYIHMVQLPAADVRPVKIGHYVTDDIGDSSCSECGEKYLDITKRFCPECGAELRRNDGDQ